MDKSEPSITEAVQTFKFPSWARSRRPSPKRKRPVLSHRPLPLLGSNQDSPDPEGCGNQPNSSNLLLPQFLVQYWFSLPGENAVLPDLEYERMFAKSLVRGGT